MITKPANVVPLRASDELTASATPWLSVPLAVGAGILAAFQVGKVHIALPSIWVSFSLSLVDGSRILSALSVVGLFFATLTGSFAARIGTHTTTILGLVLIAASSAAGGYSPTAAGLVSSRLFEGIGFVMVVVAAPSLIVELVSRTDVRIALAAWSCYMPGGVAVITFLAPLLLAHHSCAAYGSPTHRFFSFLPYFF